MVMDVKFISHRGNLNGPNKKTENTVKQIDFVLNEDFDCEIDVWLINEKLYLGHDNPENEITLNWLDMYKQSLWIHCKNFEALNFFKNLDSTFNYFWHQKDDFTLTSKGYIWTYPEQKYDKNSVIVKLDNKLPKNLVFHGVCTDFVIEMSNSL